MVKNMGVYAKGGEIKVGDKIKAFISDRDERACSMILVLSAVHCFCF
jgi:hypothetical protein